MNRAGSISKNTLVTFFGSNVTKFISMVLIIFIARVLGDSDYGTLSFALSFVGMFSILIDLGTRLLIVREVAKDKTKAAKYVTHVLLLKILTSLVIGGAIIMSVNLLGYSSETRIIVAIATAGMIFEQLSFSLQSAFQAFEKLAYSAFTQIVKKLTRLLILVPLLFIGYGIYTVMLVFAGTQFLGFLLNIYLYRTRIATFKTELNFSLLSDLVRRGFPFFLSSAFVMLYFRIDVTMLSKLAPTVLPGVYGNATREAVIGWYSAAYNLVDGIITIPSAVSAAVLPVMVIYFNNRHQKLKELYRSAVRYLSLLSFPIAAGGTLFADKIILLIYSSAYSNSIIALRILVWIFIPLFINYMMGALLIAINKEVLGVYALLSNVIVNIALNLYLIPKFSYVGSAIATVGTEVFYFFAYFLILARYGYVFNPLKIFLKPFLASLGMAAILLILHNLHIILLFFIGIIIYSILIYVLGGVEKEELAKLTQLKRTLKN